MKDVPKSFPRDRLRRKLQVRLMYLMNCLVGVMDGYIAMRALHDVQHSTGPEQSTLLSTLMFSRDVG